MWVDRADYALHPGDGRAAAIGFVIGNLIAILAAILFVRVPVSERLARGINIAIFALPPIAIVPVLVLALAVAVVLAAIAVYFRP
jgi:ABC-type nitrate/sulfonate/bicarbonate transport system permease component